MTTIWVAVLGYNPEHQEVEIRHTEEEVIKVIRRVFPKAQQQNSMFFENDKVVAYYVVRTIK